LKKSYFLIESTLQAKIQKYVKRPYVMSGDAWSNLDKVDQKIIEILNNNARTPSKEIAAELKKSGHDVSDRTIRKRIERLEKSGIIKGYKAVLTDVSGINEYQVILMKLKPSKSLETVKDSIKEFITKLDNYLLVANMEGEWNMFVIIQIDSAKTNTSQKIVEKFSDELIDYRINEIDIKDANILNMSLLLL
jgi:Lrp/AsnC family leucine-responsive transcriptional regulator